MMFLKLIIFLIYSFIDVFFWMIFWMISRPRGEMGVVVGLHLQAKQWQQAETVFQAGSEALPKGDSVFTPFFKKKTGPTSLVSKEV